MLGKTRITPQQNVCAGQHADKGPSNSISMGAAGELYHSSLHFTVSFMQKSKRKTAGMLMKTGLKHNCVKAQGPASLKSISVHVCVSTGVCRSVYASGLGIKLQDSASAQSACLG